MRIQMKTVGVAHLSTLMDEFISVKKSQKVVERTITDYRKTFNRFLNDCSNTTDYKTLKGEVSAFFENIPDTSPAVFNRPYSNLNTLFNWMVKQEYLPKNPLKDLELKKRVDEGNVCESSHNILPARIEIGVIVFEVHLLGVLRCKNITQITGHKSSES